MCVCVCVCARACARSLKSNDQQCKRAKSSSRFSGSLKAHILFWSVVVVVVFAGGGESNN